MKKMKTLDDFDFNGKTVLVRIDINSPCEQGKVTSDKRIMAHWPTLKELSEKGAKVVVLAHQGRPGKPDFISLDEHVRILEKNTGKKLKFVEDVMGVHAREQIKAMKPGDILFLDNVRFMAEETLKKDAPGHAQSNLVRRLAPLFDIFVNDGFSVAHRSHASVVGFTHVLPSAAGRLMEREVTAAEKVLEDPRRPSILVLGGIKAEDSIKVMENTLDKGSVDKVLTCGLIGELFMAAKGVDIGEPNMDTLRKLEAYDYIDRAADLLKRYPDKVEVPVDVAVTKQGKRVNVKPNGELEDMIKDIGDETIERYVEIIRNAKTICMNGPAGVYENPIFAKGTIEIFKAIKEATKAGAFSLLGGGHTSAAIEELGFSRDDFSYVSLAGGALITQLSGEELPGVEALKSAPSKKMI